MQLDIQVTHHFEVTLLGIQDLSILTSLHATNSMNVTFHVFGW